MILRLLPLLAFVLLAGLLWQGIGKDTTHVPSPLIDRPAPDFTLPRMDGAGTLGLTDLRGRPFILNVWASWCAGCQLEHPVFNAYAQRPDAIPVIGLNYKDSPDAARRWLERFGDPYRVIAVDADGRASIDWGVYGAPETFFVDAAGVIRYKHIGPIDEHTLRTQAARLGGGS